MTRMTLSPDYMVECNLINTHTHKIITRKQGGKCYLLRAYIRTVRVRVCSLCRAS